MSAPGYSRVSGEGIRLNDISTPPRTSLSLSDDSDDIVYRDNLEDEPFDNEKGRTFREEGVLEDGEGYLAEPRRAGLAIIWSYHKLTRSCVHGRSRGGSLLLLSASSLWPGRSGC